jgi:hypothetical protein
MSETQPQPGETKSAAIRRLASEGMSTKDIAAKLGVRYQHVYGVLKQAKGLAPVPAGFSRSRPSREPTAAQRLRSEADASVYDSFWDQDNNVHRVVVKMYRLVPHESPFNPSVARYVGPLDEARIAEWEERCRRHGYISSMDYDEQISLIRAVLRKNEKLLSAPTTNDWDQARKPPSPPPAT